MASAEERPRGHRPAAGAASADHHGGTQTLRTRSGKSGEHRPATNPTPQRLRSQLPRKRRRSRFRYHLERCRALQAKRRVERFEQVQDLRRQGTPIRQIARELDISPKPCAATFLAWDAPTGGPAAHTLEDGRTSPVDRRADRRGGSTPPNCMASWRREEFVSPTPRSVDRSPNDWVGPASRASESTRRSQGRRTSFAEATLLRLGPPP